MSHFCQQQKGTNFLPHYSSGEKQIRSFATLMSFYIWKMHISVGKKQGKRMHDLGAPEM